MLRSLVCNKTLKKVCCPDFDDSESKDIYIAENDENVEYLKNLTSR